MSDRMLVVASETLSPLCTDSPIPTDGQPEWGRCTVCSNPGRTEPGWKCTGHSGGIGGSFRHEPSEMAPDGPFPFTVAVWQEVEECEGCGSRSDYDQCPVSEYGLHTFDKFSAVTRLVEVVGPSHHADECADDCCDRFSATSACMNHESNVRHCHLNAMPNCWHTPTGKVTVLDRPIPMERPVEQYSGAELYSALASGHAEVERDAVNPEPQDFWWADLDLQMQDSNPEGGER